MKHLVETKKFLVDVEVMLHSKYKESDKETELK